MIDQEEPTTPVTGIKFVDTILEVVTTTFGFVLGKINKFVEFLKETKMSINWGRLLDYLPDFDSYYDSSLDDSKSSGSSSSDD